jgi:hypothetical protein
MTNASESPSATPPKTLWEKVLNYTPVVMTVIATLLAGMSNSELSAAQYERAAAAQYQSKAADQWSYFQVKKIRGTAMDNTLDVLMDMTQAGALNPAALAQGAGEWAGRIEKIGKDVGAASPGGDDRRMAALKSSVDESKRTCPKIVEAVTGPMEAALVGVGGGAPPAFTPQPIKDESVRAAVDAIDKGKPEEEIAAAARKVSDKAWDDAFKTSTGNSTALDGATGATGKALDSLRSLLETQVSACRAFTRACRELGAAGPATQAEALQREVETHAADLTAARLQYGARRYALEAPLNQELALLTEIKVHQSNLAAEQHRQRSRLFFVGVLIAQASVIGATLALAMKQKSILWALAAVAGVTALAFGMYVRLFV